jgi:hypothetical protein
MPTVAAVRSAQTSSGPSSIASSNQRPPAPEIATRSRSMSRRSSTARMLSVLTRYSSPPIVVQWSHVETSARQRSRPLAVARSVHAAPQAHEQHASTRAVDPIGLSVSTGPPQIGHRALDSV